MHDTIHNRLIEVITFHDYGGGTFNTPHGSDPVEHNRATFNIIRYLKKKQPVVITLPIKDNHL